MGRRSKGKKHHSVKEWDGFSVRFYDDAETVFTLIELLSDKAVDPITKIDIAAEILFLNTDAVIEAIDNPVALITDIVSNDLGFNGEDQKKVIDWEKDAVYISPSIYMTYGKSFEELKTELSFKELCELVMLCPHDTPIGQALYYRTAAEPKRTKYNNDEIEEFRKRRAFWALDNDESLDSMVSATNNVFESMRKAAKNG